MIEILRKLGELQRTKCMPTKGLYLYNDYIYYNIQSNLNNQTKYKGIKEESNANNNR